MAKRTHEKMAGDTMQARVRRLIANMLQVLERKVGEVSDGAQQWEMMFAAKDSAVVSLQKLAKLMDEVEEPAPAFAPVSELLSKEEMKLLEEWLRDSQDH